MKYATAYKGFSLMEIIVIMSIISGFFSIGIPYFRSIQPNLVLNNVTQQLVSNLRYIQQLTVSEQTDHAIYFINGQKGYEIRRYGAPVTIIDTVVLPDEITSMVITNFNDISGDKEARYNPYGAIHKEGTILLTNSQNTTTTISVRPSGFVKIIK